MVPTRYVSSGQAALVCNVQFVVTARINFAAISALSFRDSRATRSADATTDSRSISRSQALAESTFSKIAAYGYLFESVESILLRIKEKELRFQFLSLTYKTCRVTRIWRYVTFSALLSLRISVGFYSFFPS
jgi:hypothetical protein